MKDAKGHGSNQRGSGIGAAAKARAREGFRTGSYAGATAAISHQQGVSGAVPTVAQFGKYRADQRESVRRIVAAIQSGTIPKSAWAVGVISRARAAHSGSIIRQNGLGK